MLFGLLLSWPSFPLLIAPNFGPGVFDRRLRGYLLLWQRLLSCVLLGFLLFLHLPTSLIAIKLPIAQDRLISFHDSVNSLLPLPPNNRLLSTLLCLLSSLDSLRSSRAPDGGSDARHF